ncbi:ApbA_C domain-containing protein [Pseudoscourfieldia marina]
MSPSDVATVVGSRGRVGRAFTNAARRMRKYRTVQEISTRPSSVMYYPLLGGEGDPIFVATTADSIQCVINATPPKRRNDLVWMQNGILTGVLGQHHLADTTRAVLRLSAQADGSFQSGSLASVVHGTHAHDFANILRVGGGVDCDVTSNLSDVDVAAFQKLLWSTAVPLLCNALGGVDVAHVIKNAGDDLDMLVRELAYAAAPHALGRNLHDCEADSAVAHVRAYSADVSSSKPSSKLAQDEWAWRNGWFLEKGSTPLHVSWVSKSPDLCHLLDV